MFKQEVKDVVGNEYVFLDTYINSHTKLRVKHNKCNNVYKVQPSDFLRGSRCPYCYGNAKKTNDQFRQKVYDLVEDEYMFIDPYVNTSTKIRVKHNKCGHIYKVDPSSFLRGSRCPKCFDNHKKTNAQFKHEVYNLVGNDYIFLEPYVNSYTKIKVKHNKCGHVYKVKPNAFLNGKRCPSCAVVSKRKTDAQFEQVVHNLVGDEYTFLDNYVDARTKLRVKHNKCGNTYEVTPSNFLQGCRCPYCNKPKGEDIINKILKSLNIKYEYQKTFDDLRDVQPLSYDFFIPDQNILIEYQGIQHYQPIGYFGGGTTFMKQQKHDKMKADYAKDHNYNLITVPYTKDTISKIKKYLIKHGLSK